MRAWHRYAPLSLGCQLLVLFLGLSLVACDGSKSKTADPCDPNLCLEANKTQCAEENGLAVCSCDPGYRDDGTGACLAYDACLEDTACADQSRVCTAAGDEAVCGECLEGYHEDDEGLCVADEVCQADSCHEHGTCDAATGVVVCTCEVGYSGDHCEACAAGFHDDGQGACVLDQQCLPTSCDAHGTCDDSGGVVICTCETGYAGDHCDACAEDFHWDDNGACMANEHCTDNLPCGENGTCDDTSGLIECQCAPGYDGELCQLCAAGFHDDGSGECVLDEQCLANTCSGHGTCEADAGLVSCTSCDTGYTGDHCESCDTNFHLNLDTGLCDSDEDCDTSDPCGAHGTCHDDTGLMECSCELGWDGEHCEGCAPSYHDDDGACVLDEQCLPNTCSGHGTCEFDQGVVACTSCDEGYDGAWCENCASGYHLNSDTGLCDVDVDCSGITCNDHGSCQVTGGLPECVCNPGYEGDLCQDCAPGYHVDDALECVLDEQCLPNTCSGHGICEFDQGVVACTSCDEGYDGAWCENCAGGYHLNAETGLCDVDVDCSGITCNGHGTCQVTGGLPECVCSPGYEGDLCQACAPGYHDDSGACVLDEQCLPNTCSGHGTCGVNLGVVACTSCDEGYTGAWCEHCGMGYHLNPVNDLCEIDVDCSGITCSGHGSCQVTGGLPECVCNAGYEGDLCQDCAPGYHDDGAGACVLDEQCLPNTCSGHGTCAVNQGVVSCTSCDAGYDGSWCEQCASGYHLNSANELCEIDVDCSGITCNGHGACQVTGGLPECVCNPGYQGDLCQDCAPGYHDDGAGACVLDEQCLPNTCSGHGTCAVNLGVVSCTSCDTGYDGAWCEQCASGYHLNPTNEQCEIDVDCSGITCNGHGACQVTGGLPECVCNAGYQGDLCQDCAPGYHADSGSCVLDQQCLANTCSGHGTCAVNLGVVSCTSCDMGYDGAWCELCASGYHLNPANELCEADVDCSGITCSGHGSCQVTGGLPQCVCNSGYQGDDCESCAAGYHDESGSCVLDQQCLPNTCSGHGTCAVNLGVVSCTSCDTGYSGTWCGQCATDYHLNPANGLCEADESCSGVTCSGHGSCALQDGLAVCLCDGGYTGADCEACAPGYHLSGGLCLADETCSGVTCSGHGSCYLQGGQAFCACDTGYAGSDCASCYAGYAVNAISGLCEIPCDGWGPDAIRCAGVCVSAGDTQNCGGCGNICSGDEICNYDGSTYQCLCPVGPLWDPACGGMCVDLAWDESNCGSCGNICPVGDKCLEGQCYTEDPAECPSFPCDESTLCCENNCLVAQDFMWDSVNCGGCGNDCGGLACVLGACYSGDSSACNGGVGCFDPMNEVCCSDPRGSGPECLMVMDLQYDTQNCGQCQNACALNESCVDGQCACPTWSENYDECGGVCTVVGSDEQNCGMCGNPCLADEMCLSGNCVAGNGPTDCAGLCVDGSELCCIDGPGETCFDEGGLNTNEHCGGCDPCGSMYEDCMGGQCLCPDESMGDLSFTRCAGVCTPLYIPENCGSCGNVCTGDEQCNWVENPMDPDNSGYDCECPFPDTCAGLCTDIMTSHEHCGGCGQPCAALEICQDGGCRVAVLINEVYYDAPGGDTLEVFTELYGLPGYDLSGMKLVGVNGTGDVDYVTISMSDCGGGPCQVGPDGYFLIAHTASEPMYPGMVDLVDDGVDFQNGNESVQLRLLDDTVVDAVAYGNFGTDPHAGEGTPAVGVAPGNSLCRMGHLDSNDNSVDFFEMPPSPRADCPADIGYAVLQHPFTIDIPEGMPTELIYGQIWVAGITDQPGDSPLIQAQLGYGPRDSDPMMGMWMWFDADYNQDDGNNNEYELALNPPAGSYDYAYRFRVGDGAWLYADQVWGDGYIPAQAGKMSVLPWCIQPGFDLGSALGPVAMDTTCGQMDDLMDSMMCFGPTPGEDVAYMWTAPANGDYQIQFCQPGAPWGSTYELRWGCENTDYCEMGMGGCAAPWTGYLNAGQTLVLVIDSMDGMQCGDFAIDISLQAPDLVPGPSAAISLMGPDMVDFMVACQNQGTSTAHDCWDVGIGWVPAGDPAPDPGMMMDSTMMCGPLDPGMENTAPWMGMPGTGDWDFYFYCDSMYMIGESDEMNNMSSAYTVTVPGGG